MLKIALLFAATAFGLAMFAPQLLLSLQPAPTARENAAIVSAAPPASNRRSESSGEQRIAADAHGQYWLDVLIAGRSVRMLVDTGATTVVISADVAARLGLRPDGRKWRVHTANGDSIETETLLPSVELGGIYMPDVQALIAPFSAGEVNLLGASFLKRLASVESRDGELILRQ